MPMPGAGDPYFYEWYVGLENVIRMLNPDSGIRCVVFQHDEYDTVDDVVVEYIDGGIQMCYQVKHNIETAVPKSLTFGSMLDTTGHNICLFEAVFRGWKKACVSSGFLIKPILFTNRKIHNRRSGRHVNGKPYSAYPVDQFITKMQTIIAETADGVSLVVADDALKCQWEELCSTLSGVDHTELISFMKNFRIEGNQCSLKEMKRSLLALLAGTFSCEDSVALELFGRLLIGLTEWTTTGRTSREVTLEDVYAVLGVGEDVDESQHRLAYPYPFFESRRLFCETLVQEIKGTSNKVVFISGDPGSGKTSTISFLQSEYNIFSLRYHTFRPISPEQHFYNADPGVCTSENLWGTLLIQLRKKMKGRLAEYHVPVSNKLLSVEEMRSYVMRLLGILGKKAKEAGEKEYICIDGIDHAARANIPVTFLTSLPMPSEIPDGVCFILAGQPTTLYQDQYPRWLSTSTEIERISMPKLDISDIKQLIEARAVQFVSTADELAQLIYQRTEGNNLSTVFAVEEIRQLNCLDDVVAKMQQRRIGGDIQQYYNHIWAHMKAELSGIMSKTIFPESVIACPILLMNGRVNTRILASALNYGVGQPEWNMLLDRLFPLVTRVGDDGEYALFHNDFRVFLMGIIHSYQARYEEIALSLAKYLLQNDEGILSYVMGIPLLQCAQKEELIPQYFTVEFVVNALAEGVSKARLDEFAHLSYDAACKYRDYVGYRNTYFALKTLYQHKRYYEYYDKEYKSTDYPEINAIDISEIRTLPLKSENLSEFEDVLILCEKLYLSDREECKERALRLYHKWFQEYSPISFVSLCANTISEENAWELESTEVGIFLRHWGTLAAKMNILVTNIKEDLSKCEMYAVFAFGEQYFDYCVTNKEYDLAIGAMKAGYVDQQTFSEKVEDIYYAGVSAKFSSALTHLDWGSKDVIWNLLALAMKATCDPTFQPDRSHLEAVPPIHRVYDQTSFSLVLKAFLLGCIEKDLDDKTLICHVDEYCTEIEDEKSYKDQAAFMARVAVLLGKYYWIDDHQSNMLERYSEWLLSASLQRPIEYSKARRFLLYTLLHSEPAQTMAKTDAFINALRKSLFEIGLLGMFYKSYILDFLAHHNHHDIIKEYIDSLYGENCVKISLEENKAGMHKCFCPYGELVEPEMMRQFADQLKWDVVGYLGYKEYALQAPLDCFEIIVNNDPSRWRNLGSQLHEQSEIASLSSKHDVYEVNNCITKVAAKCGIADYWELRKWDDEFRLSPNQIYLSLFEFIKAATDLKDLQVIWILSCGIHSWYTQSERHGAKCVFNACLDKAQEINADFSQFVSTTTPQWESIVIHLSEDSSDYENYDKYHTEKAKERSRILAMYNDLSVDDALDNLVTVERKSSAIDHYRFVLEKVLACNNTVPERLVRLLHSFCIYLNGKEWAYENCDSIVMTLLSVLGWDAFWTLAESNSKHLSDYDYQTSTRNMQWLLKLKCNGTITEMEDLFTEELHTQRTWVTGNNHFNIHYVHEKNAGPFACIPQSLAEMALYILLEQADTQNARKMEAAIYAIYLLGMQFPSIMSVIAEQWLKYSQIQEECLLIVIARWAAEGACSKEMNDFLLNMYNACSELSRKYYLHSILLKTGDPSVDVNTISCTAPASSYTLPQDGVFDNKSCYENFLSMVERRTGKATVDAIRKFIFEKSPLESYKDDNFGEIGDSNIPAINMLPGVVFYDKEKCGEWESIPLTYKKAHLLPPEDPFILTEMPRMVFDSEWLPDLNHDGELKYELESFNLHNIVHSHIMEDEIVLAASLWYPWGHKEGTIYMESTKIDLFKRMQSSSELDVCLGNYGLLASEGTMAEANHTTIGTGGFSLFNRVCGSIKLLFGNCQLAPSSVWRRGFGCKPSDKDPYKWVNNSGLEVLRFERIASPVREAMRENYIRQPILFRWICKKSWLKKMLQNEQLCIYPFSMQEQYP